MTRARFAARYGCATLLLLLALLWGGCATPPQNLAGAVTHAWETPESTTLGAYFSGRQPADGQDLSGLRLLDDPRDAFRARFSFAAQAERTLDLQYYLWKGDLTGELLLQQVLAAADRGVRVRILIDDIYHKGRDDVYATLSAHPQVSVRVFNPMGNRNIGRNLNYAFNKRKLNHRMHNKIFLVDNSVAILGGRNIGDDYFGINPKLNFHDLDVLAVGPVAMEAGEAFDTYWNSRQAVPAKQLVSNQPDSEDLARMRRGFSRNLMQAATQLPYSVPQTVEELTATLDVFSEQLTWARARVLVDPLERFNGDTQSVFTEIGLDISESAQRQVNVQTAYLIPNEQAIAAMKRLTDRGVRLRIMTNSLMSNNHISVHGHYARYREDLLRAGVELYELRADAELLEHYRQQDSHIAASHSGLHTKAFSVDGEWCVVGSYNMDPRSRIWNSEIGLRVDSRAFTAQVDAVMEQEFSSENAYRLSLDEDGDLVWSRNTPDGIRVHHKDPGSSWFKRILARIIGWIPIEEEL